MSTRCSFDEILDVLADAATASPAGHTSVERVLGAAFAVMVPRIADACAMRFAAEGETLELVTSVRADAAIDLSALAAVELDAHREGGPRVVQLGEASALVAPVRWGSAGAGVVTLASRSHRYDGWSGGLVRRLCTMIARLVERTALQRDLERQRDRLRLLADISHAFNGHLSPVDVARVIARGIGGAIAIVLFNPDGTSTLHAFADIDPAVEARMRSLQGQPLRNDRVEPGTVFHRVLSGQTYFRIGPGALDDLQPVWASAVRGIVAELGASFNGCIAAPLCLDRHIFGLLGVARHGRAPPFEPDDVSLVQQIAERAAVAIDRLRLWEEQVRLFEREQAAVASRDEFLAFACHELNTPLTALTLQLQSMQRHEGSLDPAKVDAAARQVGRLNKLVSELFDVAHLRDDRVHLEPETFDLAEVVHEVAHRFSGELSRSGSSLALDLRGPCVGRWDHMRVEQAVASILSNAIKYGLGRPIDVSVACEEGVARMVVRDRGIGIARGDQERIFERFGHVAPRDHYGGLGLGLWSARRVIEASGGRIRVDSARDEGSTFTMELPAPLAEARAQPAAATPAGG
jgi:signal transduction histidine kinase